MNATPADARRRRTHNPNTSQDVGRRLKIHRRDRHKRQEWMECERQQQTLTLMTLSSSAWQELWSVTSATFPAWVTMKTFMTCDTWRPVSTAVFMSSQFCKTRAVKDHFRRDSRKVHRTFEIGSTDWMSSFWISNFATNFLRCSSCGWIASTDMSLAFGPSWT